MSDTYILHLRCDWCGEMNNDVGYSDYINQFACEYCEKPNSIILRFESRKIKAKAPNKSDGGGK